MTHGVTLHPLVEQVFATRRITRRDGSTIEAHSFIPRDECELIYRQIADVRPSAAIEIGMAFGISTLCVCDSVMRAATADARNDAPSVIVVDPFEHDETWRGVGIEQVQAAGFWDIVEFHEEASQQILPRLVNNGARVQFAMIDGWHTFDHTLVDFFYIDRLLDTHGVIVFDDVTYPSINAVVRFVVTNRGYELVEAVTRPRPRALLRDAKSRLSKLASRCAASGTISREDFSRISAAHAVALRKLPRKANGNPVPRHVREVLGDDDRRWDHFHPF